MKKTHNIDWILFHAPVEIFLRTAEAFSKEIGQLTDGRIKINVYQVEEYCNKFNSRSHTDPISLVKSGKVQMSQIQTNWLGHENATDFYALDLPFLFSSHEHATRVLEGEIGKSLLDSLPAKINMRGLAFTYSGGYRAIASTEIVNSVEEMQGRSMAVRTSPIGFDMAKAFGTTPGVLNDLVLETRKEDSRQYDMVQTTLPRYSHQIDSDTHPYIINTRHNMFLTTIIINEAFWNELDAEDQQLMRQAAFSSAQQERKWSVDDANKIETDKDEQKRLGIKGVVEFSDIEIDKLKAAAIDVYAKYNDVFSPGLVDSIKAA
jgi:TRAP-type transport system periplasmic protein